MFAVGARAFSAYALLNSEQASLREVAAQYVDEKIKPDAHEIDKTNTADIRRYMKDLGELGMIGVTVPEQYGGSELGYLDHCVIGEEISRGSPAVGMSYGASANLCSNQLVLNGTEEQKERFLPDLCSGERIGALAMSEPGSGSDVMSMKTNAKKTEGGWILNGNKFWITNGPIADILIVYARTDPEDRNQGITAFIVERDMKGFSRGTKLDKFGQRGSDTGELIFEDVFIPDENVLGEVNRGTKVLMSGLNIERLILATGPVGIMQACLDECMPYVTTRKQFGQPIGNFQLIQSKLAEMYTALHSSRTYLYTAAMEADKGVETNELCASVALYTSRWATKVALEAMQIFGGNGYINDYPLGRFVRDAKLYEIGGGTQEIRKVLIAKELLKQYK